METPKEDDWPHSPLAVLMTARGAFVRTMVLPDVLPEVRVPVPTRFSLSAEEPPKYAPIVCRTFKLSPSLRSRDHRWWHVYNNGRSKTPMDGLVYVEVPTPPQEGE